METARRSIQQQQSIDVTELLPQVTAPSVVLYPRGTAFPTMDMARTFASGIPRARLAIVESASYWTDASTQASLRVLDEFLEEKAREADRVPDLAPAGIASRMPSLVTGLFTDIVGHTEMMQRLGDAKGRDVLRQHEQITRDTLRQHAGAEVKTMGDGFMASFGSVTRALECAIALQRAFASRNQEPGTESLQLRVGLNAGEPIEEDGDLFGSTVILASRIASSAGPGEILTSVAVRELCAGKGFLFADRAR